MQTNGKAEPECPECLLSKSKCMLYPSSWIRCKTLRLALHGLAVGLLLTTFFIFTVSAMARVGCETVATLSVATDGCPQQPMVLPAMNRFDQQPGPDSAAGCISVGDATTFASLGAVWLVCLVRPSLLALLQATNHT